MEYLDIYNEQGEFLGKEERSIVHRDALWHKTVHCWLYDKTGDIYFQIRKVEGTLYTTSSGHVQAGETVKEGFGREIKEEIGVDVNYEKAILVNVVNFVMDRENKDGTIFKDRAFANVYICEFDNSIDAFNFDPNEVRGIVKVNAKETLDLLTKESGTIKGKVISFIDGKNVENIQDIDFNDFLVNKGETALGKYGDVLRKVIETLES